MDDLLDIIDMYHGHPRIDRRGERWTLCPFHSDRKVRSFSYGPRGFCCFACGQQGSLRQLAEHLGLADSAPFLPRVRRVVVHREPEPQPERPWQQDPRILDRFQPISAAALTYAHQRGLTAETIKRWRIGSGMLPSSRAKFPRLILPVIEGGRVVGLRGRAIDSRDVAPKWLQSAGSLTTLFGLDELRARPGSTVIVCEAPLACVLAMQELPDVVAVSPVNGAASWRDEWTAALVEASPSDLVIAYDNDLAGWPNRETYELAAARWRRDHPTQQVPEPNGVKLARQLIAAGLRPVHYDWRPGRPEKWDLADELTTAKVAA